LIGFLTAELIPLGQAELKGLGSPTPGRGRDPFSYRDVVQKVLPAVVYIEASGRGGLARGRFLPEQAGSGAIIDPSGVIVTNNHVVSGVDQVEVHLKDGRKFTSRSILTDPKSDLAIVRIKSASPLPYIELGDSDAIEIGDRVLAVGAPFGLAGSVTHGIISAKGRDLNLSPYSLYQDYLQTDAAINPGNSGGPLVNMDGQIIGINTAIKSQSGGFQGIGLAIPSNLVRTVVSQLAREGVVRRGYLGIQMQDVDEQIAEKLNLGGTRGVVVVQVYPNTPAAKAGLKEMDIITEVNGRKIAEGKELQRAVFNSEIGKPVELTILREGKLERIKVIVEEQPEDYGLVRGEPGGRRPNRDQPGPEGVYLESIGIEVSAMTPELAEQWGYRDARGVVISRVEPGSLASNAGLRPGMVIVRAERQNVDSPAQLEEILKKASLAKGVLLQIRTPAGGSRFVILRSDS
jgi:serine protease Do